MLVDGFDKGILALLSRLELKKMGRALNRS